MLRSWNKAARASYSAGLAFSRDRLRYVEMVRHSGHCEIVAVGSKEVQATFINGNGKSRDIEHLTETIAQLAGGLRHRYIPIHISLADPWIRTAIFELDQLPARDNARETLVQFRMTRESALEEACFATQALGLDNDKHLLLGIAVPQTLKDVITSALANAGLTAWSMAGHLIRALNLFAVKITGSPGALVVHDAESWSIAIFDAAGRIRHVRSQWRINREASAVATEIQRVILAYVHSAPNRIVESIWLMDGTQTDEIARELDARSDQPCRRLALSDHVTSNDSSPLIDYAVPIAAALQ